MLLLLLAAGHDAFADICLTPPAWDECGGGEEGGFIDMDEAKDLTHGPVTGWVEVE